MKRANYIIVIIMIIFELEVGNQAAWRGRRKVGRKEASCWAYVLFQPFNQRTLWSVIVLCWYVLMGHEIHVSDGTSVLMAPVGPLQSYACFRSHRLLLALSSVAQWEYLIATKFSSALRHPFSQICLGSSRLLIRLLLLSLLTMW